MMRPIAPSLIVLAWFLAAGAPQAGADVPSPPASYVAPHIVTCPAGDSVFLVIARHADGRPYEFGETRIHLCVCPDVTLAPMGPGAPYQMFDPCTPSRYTDAEGASAFPLAAGGVCTDASIVVECDGVILATRAAVASFDQDGDEVVGFDDVQAVQAKVGTDDPTADFDGDGHVTTLDAAIATDHLGHGAGALGVGDPGRLALAAVPAPNPGRGPIAFVLRTAAGGRASLAVYDVSGRRLANVLDRELGPGVSRVTWSGRDDAGRQVGPGLYFYRFAVGGRSVRGTVVVRR
jgi:hypothetical protein